MSWPQELRKPRVLANFKNRGAREKHRNSERFKQRAGMSEAHLVLIRQMQCCTCMARGGDPHHLKAGTGERGTGLRSTDRWAVPMCRTHHDEVERIGSRNETTWFLERGVNAHELASALWVNTGDLAKMMNVLVTHRELQRDA